MPFDTQFGRAKAAYVAHRPTYPEAIYQLITDALGTARDKAVDLGAGTGLSTAPLCERFREVVAIEPDPAMAEELRRAVPNARVLQVPAEEFPADLAPVNLVTVANAFYWMDGPVIAERVAQILGKSGLFAVYRHKFPTTGAGPVRAILEAELTDRWDQFRDRRLADEGYSRRVIESANSLAQVELHTVSHGIDRTAAQIVGLIRSTSFGAAYLRSLSDPSAYVTDLEQRIKSVIGEGQVRLDLNIELILARRRSA
jgi:trans-aconitate methyltransferase